MNIRELEKTKKIKNNREANADEEASTEKAAASTKTASAEPRTAEKNEGCDKPKRVKRDGEKKSQLKGKREIENERFQLQKMSVEAKAKVASEVVRQNDLTAEKNKLSAETNTHAIAKTILESGHAIDEQKKEAVDVLMGLLKPNTSTR